MRPNGIIIAIDGPSGAGKSTIARMLAERLGYTQIDTGAMYRAAAYMLSSSEVDLENNDAVESFLRDISITIEQVLGSQIVRVNGMDVTKFIRTPEMSLLTSRISAIKPVREAMLKSQQNLGKMGGVVLEGRDIGTIVFPDAELKFYLIASVKERAKRRFEELTLKGVQVSFEETVTDVAERDRQDSERDIAPLKQADDAILIDSSMLTIEEVLTEMLEKCRAKNINMDRLQ